jgi:hypothetical protein
MLPSAHAVDTENLHFSRVATAEHLSMSRMPSFSMRMRYVMRRTCRGIESLRCRQDPQHADGASLALGACCHEAPVACILMIRGRE